MKKASNIPGFYGTSRELKKIVLEMKKEPCEKVQ